MNDAFLVNLCACDNAWLTKRGVYEAPLATSSCECETSICCLYFHFPGSDPQKALHSKKWHQPTKTCLQGRFPILLWDSHLQQGHTIRSHRYSADTRIQHYHEDLLGQTTRTEYKEQLACSFRRAIEQCLNRFGVKESNPG